MAYNFDEAKQEFDAAITHVISEFNGLRVGRASAGLVENIQLEAYGSTTTIKAVSTVSIPDAKTIQIQPWDRGLLASIEKGISNSDLGLNPMNDGICIRIKIPELNEERRKELKKVVSEKAESGRIHIRTVRQKFHNELKKMKEASEITEDDFFMMDKKLQDIVSEYTTRVDKLQEEKEQDIMKI